MQIPHSCFFCFSQDGEVARRGLFLNRSPTSPPHVVVETPSEQTKATKNKKAAKRQRKKASDRLALAGTEQQIKDLQGKLATVSLEKKDLQGKLANVSSEKNDLEDKLLADAAKWKKLVEQRVWNKYLDEAIFQDDVHFHLSSQQTLLQTQKEELQNLRDLNARLISGSLKPGQGPRLLLVAGGSLAKDEKATRKASDRVQSKVEVRRAEQGTVRGGVQASLGE